MKVILETSLDH